MSKPSVSSVMSKPSVSAVMSKPSLSSVMFKPPSSAVMSNPSVSAVMSKPSVPIYKWVAKPMVSKCGVCGTPADNVKHYGAEACYSCRAFFRRATQNETRSQNCARKTNFCYVDSVSRNNCKKCRYEKCLKVGMRPEKVNRVKKRHLEAKKSDMKNGEIIENKDSVVNEIIDMEENGVNVEDSNTSDTNVDINALVEECVENEGHFDLMACPSFQLTHEEEFKIFELYVRKENLNDGLFRLFFHFPGFLEAFHHSLLSLGLGKRAHQDFIKIIDQKSSFIESNLASGGTIRQSLDMFDEFKNVSEKVKTKVLQFSLSVFRVCNRAHMKENMDKEYFVDQYIAAGMYNISFKQTYETIFPNNRYAVKSFDPFSVGNFTSPWAVRYEDEVFFLTTFESVGKIVKDDVHLGALYSTLILATPGAKLADDTKNDPALQKVQVELSLLLFRYLRKKYGNNSLASDTTNNLLKLLGDLHICRDIYMFNRLPVFNEEVSEDSIDEIEISVEELILNCGDD